MSVLVSPWYRQSCASGLGPFLDVLHMHLDFILTAILGEKCSSYSHIQVTKLPKGLLIAQVMEWYPRKIKGLQQMLQVCFLI